VYGCAPAAGWTVARGSASRFSGHAAGRGAALAEVLRGDDELAAVAVKDHGRGTRLARAPPGRGQQQEREQPRPCDGEPAAAGRVEAPVKRGADAAQDRGEPAKMTDPLDERR